MHKHIFGKCAHKRSAATSKMAEAVHATTEHLEELEILASLFDEKDFGFSQNSFDFSSHPLYSGWFKFLPRLESSLTVVYETQKQSRKLNVYTTGFYDKGVQYRSYKLDCFPPITLKFILPTEYPNATIPRFAFLCSWLSPAQLNRLSEALCEYALKCLGEAQLWHCFQFVETSITSLLELPLTNVGHVLNLGDVFNSKLKGSHVAVELFTFQQEHKQRLFKQSLQECLVCAEVTLGKDSTLVRACGHAFCNKCLRRSLDEILKQGTLSGVFTCMACERTLDMFEVGLFCMMFYFRK